MESAAAQSGAAEPDLRAPHPAAWNGAAPAAASSSDAPPDKQQRELDSVSQLEAVGETDAAQSTAHSVPRQLNLQSDLPKSWDEYRDVFAQRQAEEQQQRLQRAFDALDVDKSGTISLHEIKHGLADVLGREIAPWEYRVFLRRLDTEKTNEISFTEFRDGFDMLKTSMPSGVRSIRHRAMYHLGRIYHPLEPVRRIWDAILMLVLVYSLVEIPVKVGLNVSVALYGVVWWLNLAVDMYFLLDICLFFRVGFLENDDVFVTDSKRIAREYVCGGVWFFPIGWFWIDLATSIPITSVVEIVYSIAEATADDATTGFLRVPRLLRIARILRLLKMARMIKLAKMMSSWSNPRTTIGMAKRLFEILLFFYFIAHIAGCLWIFTNFLFANEETGELPSDGWISRSPLTSYHYEQDCDKLRLYLISVYWAFATLTTVGYGDISASTTAELIVATSTMYIGTCVLGFVVGNVTTIVMEEDRDATQLRERVAELGAYMRRRGLSVPLMERVREHYDHKWKMTTIFDETAILEELPAFLRDEVIAESYSDLVRDVPMLASLSSTALSVVIMALKPQRVLPTQVIVRKGEIGSCMYIVASGLLKVHDSRSVYDADNEEWTVSPFRLDAKSVADVRRNSRMLPGVRPPKSMRYAQADYNIDVFSRGDYFGAYCLDPTTLGSDPTHAFTVVCVRTSMLFSLSSIDFVAAQAQVPNLAMQLGAGAHSADHGEAARLLSWDRMDARERARITETIDKGRRSSSRVLGADETAVPSPVASPSARSDSASRPDGCSSSLSDGDDGDDGQQGKSAPALTPQMGERKASWTVRLKQKLSARGANTATGSDARPASRGRKTIDREASLLTKLDHELGLIHSAEGADEGDALETSSSPTTRHRHMQARERRWGFLLENMGRIVDEGRDLVTSPQSHAWASATSNVYMRKEKSMSTGRSTSFRAAGNDVRHADRTAVRRASGGEASDRESPQSTCSGSVASIDPVTLSRADLIAELQRANEIIERARDISAVLTQPRQRSMRTTSLLGARQDAQEFVADSMTGMKRRGTVSTSPRRQHAHGPSQGT